MDNKDATFNANKLPFGDDDCFQDISSICDQDTFPVADQMDYCSICPDIIGFLQLTYAMVDEINDLRAEVVRWRQVLIKYLSDDWADGLRQDIFDNLYHYPYEDFDAYNHFVQYYYNGKDPMDNEKRAEFMMRLSEGTDETSITYL